MKETTWDISYNLEKIAEKIIGSDFAHSGTFFDRDIIEIESFYDVMYLFLHMRGKSGSIEFVNKYYEIKRKRMDDIQNYDVIFHEFMSLLDIE